MEHFLFHLLFFGCFEPVLGGRVSTCATYQLGPGMRDFSLCFFLPSFIPGPMLRLAYFHTKSGLVLVFGARLVLPQVPSRLVLVLRQVWISSAHARLVGSLLPPVFIPVVIPFGNLCTRPTLVWTRVGRVSTSESTSLELELCVCFFASLPACYLYCIFVRTFMPAWSRY
jgi:hypothetical protein